MRINTKNFKNNKSVKILTVVLSVLLLSAIVTGIIFFVKKNNNKSVAVDEPTSSVPVSVENSSTVSEKKPETVSFVSVGDNLIHTSIYRQANERAGGKGYDFKYAYENIIDLVKTPDIATLNQETIMAPGIPLASYPTFNSPTELGDYMVDIGFDVMNHATNHVLDKGEKGVINTLNYWKTKPQIKVVGVYENKADYENIRILEKNGVKIAFVGTTEQTNGIKLPEKTDIVLMYLSNEELLKSQIQKAKSMADAVVVNVHWGQEYTNVPNAFQKGMAQKLADWGATVIIGHHPHVIQPVEYINSSDGRKVLVAYSLGNFISAQDRGERMLGGALEYKLEKDFATDTVTIKDVKFVPLVTHFGAGYSNIKIYKLSEYNNTLAAKHGVKAKTPNFSVEFLTSLLNKVIDKEFL